MTDRDRLLELLHKAPKGRGRISNYELANYLIANGVIVPPCQKGAVLNRNGEKCIANHWNIILTAFNENNQVRLFDVKEAEQKLEELKGND